MAIQPLTFFGLMHITITEVGPRDGLQSEKSFIPTHLKVQLIGAIFATGIRSIEATSFVSPAAVPQMSDAAEGLKSINRPQGAVVSVLAPNIRGAHAAIRAGADELVAFVSASATHNWKNLNRSVADSLLTIAEVAELASQQGIALRAAIATAFGCPFEGNVDAESVVRIAQAFARVGIQHVTLADTTGMATPCIVRTVCSKVRTALPEARLSLHFHNTRGLGLLNVAAGIDLGISEYESSLAGVGGCPFAPGATGNVCTEDLVHFLHEEGHSTGTLGQSRAHARLRRHGPPRCGRREVDSTPAFPDSGQDFVIDIRGFLNSLDLAPDFLEVLEVT